MNSFFISDDFDDVRGLDPWAPEPKPAPVAPAPVPVWKLVADVHVKRGLDMCADPEFLALVDPVFAVCAQQILTQMSFAFAKGASLTGAYKPVPGARNAMEHTLYQIGVRR